ncbi:hypothetical protein Aperf_G00000040291 [Anoplocephala perfoliata]
MSSGFYHLYFIKDPLTPLQNAAFEAVSSYENLQPVWIDGNEAVENFKHSSPKNCCFVFGKFTGSTYEHFKALGSAVFGPQVLLDYLREEKPLPNVSFPLFSTALRNAIVTVTSVAGQLREYLFSSVQMLHGTTSRSLTDNVNVIISPKVGSKKYVVGAKRGIAILSPEWIDEAWKLSETLDPIDMMLNNFLEKFKLPIFAHLVVCVSGLSLEERKEVAKIVSANGGQYSGEMKIGFTTHLIVKKAGGVKYNFAKKWKVQIVNDRWLTDSVNMGFALDSADYEVPEDNGQLQNHKYSTPTSSICAQDPSLLSDISAITNSYGNRCEETGFSNLKDITNSSCSRTASHELSYLSDCVVLLYGCNASESVRLSNLIKAGGGISCTDASDKVTESFTHVVLGSGCKKFPSPDFVQNVLYVTCDWLEKCHEQHKRLPEKDFKPDFLDKTEATEQDRTEKGITEAPVDAEEIRLINEYFRDDNLAGFDDFPTFDNNNPEEQTVRAPPFEEKRGEAEKTKEETILAAPQMVEPDILDEIALSSDGLFSHLVFKPDIKFSLTANPTLSSLITNEGGTVINDSSVVADYTICSYVMRQPLTSTMITPYWIHSCLAAKSLLLSELNTEIGFRPIYIPASLSPLPLDGCSISLSGFVSNDRLFLSDLAKELGATVQECFLRKAIPSRSLLASTHLVSARPDGRKWPAAQSWGIPAVSCSWLFACANTGRRVPESEHPVKENDSMVPKNWSEICNIQKSVTFQTPQATSMMHQQSIGGKQLKTPGWVGATGSYTPNQVHTSSSSTSLDALHISPPMSEKISRCLKRALLKTAISGSNLAVGDFKFAKEDCQSTVNVQNGKILEDVVICVAKSLSGQQVILNDLAKQLGGDFRWNFDASVCTHMIACPSTCILPAPSPMQQGNGSKASETQSVLSPDVRAALEAHPKIHVVLPQWLEQCHQLSKRLPESDFIAFPKYPNLSKFKDSISFTYFFTFISVLSPIAPGGPSDRHLPGASAALEEDEFRRQPSVETTASSGASSLDSDSSSIRSRRRRSHSHSDGDEDEEDLASVQFASSGSNLALPPVKNDYITPGQTIQVRWQYEDALKVGQGHSSSIEEKRGPSSEFNRHDEKGASPEKRTPTLSMRQPQSQSGSTSITRARVFSISGVTPEEKVRYQSIITELGADLDAGMTVGETTTHLIINAPSRCEKYLMCLAGGRWILHKSYLDACAAANTWLSEEAYEWGGPGTEPLLIQLSPASSGSRSSTPGALSCAQLRELAKAARHWRRAGGRAFEGWRVVFGPGCDRESSFRRIIEFGGGRVCLRLL